MLTPVLGDDLHQPLEELAPGQRVEARHRLVEDQHFGPLGHGQGQRQLGPLAARQRAGLLASGRGRGPRCAGPASCVPAGLSRRRAEMVRHGQPGIGRRVLGDEADPGQCAGTRRLVAQHRDRARVGARSPTARLSNVDLPAPFGPTRPT